MIHQLTGLSALRGGRLAEAQAANAKIRTLGTRNLVDAACKAGARRLIAQSIAWVYAPGPLPHREEDALDVPVDGPVPVTVQGIVALEGAVLSTSALEGVVLRYGHFYGPGTGNEAPGSQLPVHVDAAAYAALLAIERAPAGSTYNIAESNDVVSTERARVELGWDDSFRLTETRKPAP